jgi:DNA-binding MarR family transcriptional regulator
MERDGWIARHDCPTDRRKKIVRAKDAAEPVWDQIVQCALRVRSQATEGLDESQLRTLRSLLQKVHQNLKELEKSKPPRCEPANGAT